MKVKDLLSKLKDLDPERDVVCCRDAEKLTVFEIVAVEGMQAEIIRGGDGTARLKLGETDRSRSYVSIVITPDF